MNANQSKSRTIIYFTYSIVYTAFNGFHGNNYIKKLYIGAIIGVK